MLDQLSPEVHLLQIIPWALLSMPKPCPAHRALLRAYRSCRKKQKCGSPAAEAFSPGCGGEYGVWLVARWICGLHLPLLPLPELPFSVATPGRLVVRQIEVTYALVNAALCPGQLQLCEALHARGHSGPLPSSAATTVAPTTSNPLDLQSISRGRPPPPWVPWSCIFKGTIYIAHIPYIL